MTLATRGWVLLLCAPFSSGGIFNGPISLYFFIFILNMYLCKAPRHRQKKNNNNGHASPGTPRTGWDEDCSPCLPLLLGTRKAPDRGQERSTSTGRHRPQGSVPALGVPCVSLSVPSELHGLEPGADAERKGRAGGICSPLLAPQSPFPGSTWGVSRAGE